MEQYRVRASNLNGYSETVRELGGDPQRLLERFGQSPREWQKRRKG
jgi:hypothetical protein